MSVSHAYLHRDSQRPINVIPKAQPRNPYNSPLIQAFQNSYHLSRMDSSLTLTLIGETTKREDVIRILNEHHDELSKQYGGKSIMLFGSREELHLQETVIIIEHSNLFNPVPKSVFS